MKKRIISWLLVLCMAATMATVPVFADFADTDGHWGEEAISIWSSYGIIKGDPNGNFNPDSNMTRAEAAAVFERLLNITSEGNISQYTDIKADDWHAGSFKKCIAAGIMNGVSATKMDPNGTLTREQMFVMLGRALNIGESKTANAPATDHGQISDWAEGIINSMLNKGYINGIGGGNIAPLASINRASVMSLLNQTITTYANAPGEVTAAKGGIVLVVSDNVIVTGQADTIVVAKADSNVTIKADANEVNVIANDVDLAVEGNVNTVNIEADNTAVSGSGKVETANVNGDNTKVDTKDTKINVAADAAGTTANGTPVANQTPSTNTDTKEETKKPSTGGGGGGGGGHRHSYTNGKCSCGDRTAERSLAISTTAAETVYSKPVADIMEGVAVTADGNVFNVSGTAKYITGWTAFNSEVEAEQTGHYITLDLAKPALLPTGETFTIGDIVFETDNDGVRLTTRLENLTDGKLTVKLHFSETDIDEYIIDFSNVVLGGRVLDIDATAAETVYSKSVADIMEGVAVTADGNVFNVSGTAKYVTGWEAFNSAVAEEQSGHYITLDLAKPALLPTGETFTIGDTVFATDNDGVRLTTRLENLTDGKLTVKLHFSETDIDEYIIDFSNVVLGGRVLDIDATAAETVYSKSVADIMEGVAVTADGNVFNVSGTAKYVTGWEAFNSAVAEEQSGHYITLDLAKPALLPTGETFTIGDTVFETDNDGVRLTTRLENLTDGKLTVKLHFSETDIDEYIIDFSNVVLGGRVLDIDATVAETVYSKPVADIMEGVAVTADGNVFNVSGTAKYVTGWEAFNSAVAEEQSGHYITLDLAKPALLPTGETFTIGDTVFATDNDGVRLTTRLENLTDGKLTVKLHFSETDIDEYIIDFSNVVLEQAE